MGGPPSRPRVVVSWSSGKDAAWLLERLRAAPDLEVIALLTTYGEAAGEVPIHGVPRQLVEAQAAALGLPLEPVPLPWPCPNEAYEAAVLAALGRLARDRGATAIAFADLFLEDVRSWREALVARSPLSPLFPLFGEPTAEVACAIADGGVVAHVTTVELARLDAAFAGRRFDRALLAELPAAVDPCGERGELHTFVSDAPSFARPVPFELGPLERDGGFAHRRPRPARRDGHETCF